MVSKGRKESGFTLLELLVNIAIIGILSAIAIPAYTTFRTRAFDAAAKGDLRNAMFVLEDYFLQNDTYPPTVGDLVAAGFNQSKDVSFTKYDVRTKDGVLSVHMHIQHANTSNVWHADYPKEGNKIKLK